MKNSFEEWVQEITEGASNREIAMKAGIPMTTFHRKWTKGEFREHSRRTKSTTPESTQSRNSRCSSSAARCSGACSNKPPCRIISRSQWTARAERSPTKQHTPAAKVATGVLSYLSWKRASEKRKGHHVVEEWSKNTPAA